MNDDDHDPSPLDDFEPLALASLVFRHWRQGCPAGSHTPEPLRRIACLVASVDPITQVAAELELDVQTLRRWQRALHAEPGTHGSDVVEAMRFVPLPAFVGVPGVAPASTLTLAIERPDGVRLLVSGAVGVATVQALMVAPAP